MNRTVLVGKVIAELYLQTSCHAYHPKYPPVSAHEAFAFY